MGQLIHTSGIVMVINNSSNPQAYDAMEQKSRRLTMMVWVPSLSASFSFFTSFCRDASERGAVLLSAFPALLGGGTRPLAPLV